MGRKRLTTNGEFQQGEGGMEIRVCD